ncbi:heat shock factor binding protein 1-domain-containing protein [Massariosphaeria phaeospora]|uniref:Heat shock factor binding protein 1-domain-containing protein n=1 Tax=Massariosphaeria phaeospora TaxID=100035 RepID=A0A7C8MNV8_9PLEO|nr:heat shock factor binding protein 1-domain-containing protein [Massariosphaeria phaeospora]
MSTRPAADRTTSEAGSITNASDNSTGELAAVVDDLLNQLNSKFNSISSELLSKMDDMSRRLDNLESTIQAGDSKGSGSGSGK